MNLITAKTIVFGTKIILQVSSINIYGWSCYVNVDSNIINILKGKVNFWTPCMIFSWPLYRAIDPQCVYMFLNRMHDPISYSDVWHTIFLRYWLPDLSSWTQRVRKDKLVASSKGEIINVPYFLDKEHVVFVLLHLTMFLGMRL